MASFERTIRQKELLLSLKMTEVFRENDHGRTPARCQDKFPVKIVVKTSSFDL